MPANLWLTIDSLYKIQNERISMKAKTYDTLVNLINTTCIYLLLLSLFFTLQGRSFDMTNGIILQTLGLCSVTFVYYFARKYIQNLIIFLLMHIAPTALYLLFFKAPTERYLYFAVFLIVFPLISMAMRYNAKPQKISATGFAPIILILGFYLFVAEDNLRLQNILSIITFIFVILVIINTYYANTYNFIISNESAIGESFSIRKESNRFFKLFLLLTTGFCLAFSSMSSNFVFKYFKGFIYMILSLIADFFVTEPKEEIVMPSVPPNDLFETPEATVTAPPTETEPLQLGLPQWVIYLVVIGFIIFVIVLTIYVVIKFFKKTPSNLEDVHEFISPFEKTERIKEKKKKKKNESISLFASYDKRIRKLFKKSISKSMNPFIKINKAHTPTQLCDSTDCAFEKGDQLSSLKALYSKARYSKDTITKEDYNEAKELSNNICTK